MRKGFILNYLRNFHIVHFVNIPTKKIKINYQLSMHASIH